MARDDPREDEEEGNTVENGQRDEGGPGEQEIDADGGALEPGTPQETVSPERADELEGDMGRRLNRRPKESGLPFGRRNPRRPRVKPARFR